MKRDWKTFVRDDYKKLVDAEKKGDAARKAKDYRKAAEYYGAAAELSVGQHNIQRFRKLVLTMKKQSSARTEGTIKTTDYFFESRDPHKAAKKAAKHQLEQVRKALEPLRLQVALTHPLNKKFKVVTQALKDFEKAVEEYEDTEGLR